MTMKTLKYITLILTLSLCTQLSAQNIDFTTDNFYNRETALEEALRALREGDNNYAAAQKICPSVINSCQSMEAVALYNEAILQYLTAQNINSNNALLNYRIGECYIFTAKQKAIPYLEKTLSLTEKVNPNVYLYMGMAYQSINRFEDAVGYYQKYKTKLTVQQYEEYGRLADKYIAECHSATKLMGEPTRVFVDNFGGTVNTAVSEFRPMVDPDGKQIYFNRTSVNGKTKENKIVTQTKNGEESYLEVPKAGCGRSLNTMLYLSSDRTSMILSSAKKNRTDLYETYVENGQWQKPRQLKKPVRSSYSESSAYLSPNGLVLFFSSNRPGGYGGYDIYMVRRDERGNWRDIMNMGAGVNTSYDEHISYVSEDGYTIYFSSQGHNSMGGFDIFKSVYNPVTNTWGEAVNLEYPINSVSDETYFYPMPDGNIFYLSSSREGTLGGQDIFSVIKMRPERNIVSTYEDNMLAYHSPRFMEYVIEPVVQMATTNMVVVSGMVVDQQTQHPVSAQITIVNNKDGKTVAQFESSEETGRFTISVPSGTNYGLIATAAGYMFQSENIDVPYEAKREYNRFIEMHTLEVDKTITLRNVFFDFGQATPTQASSYELNLLYRMMESQPSLVIEVSGHTDNRGAESANLHLSVLRARSVVDFLVKAGIDPERLSFIGYGLTKPVATNATADGRRLNRRTEIRVVSK
jgi:outer membrane protein OmpA-like peptidoglycan-associated protein